MKERDCDCERLGELRGAVCLLSVYTVIIPSRKNKAYFTESNAKHRSQGERAQSIARYADCEPRVDVAFTLADSRASPRRRKVDFGAG